MNGVGHRHRLAVEIDCNVGAFWDGNAVAGSKVVADDVNFVSSADGGINIVLDIVVIDVAIDRSFGVGEIGAFEDDALEVEVVWASVDEWEIMYLFVVISLAVEWGIVITTLKSNFALNETIVEIKDTVLFEAGRRTFEANSSAFDIDRVLVNKVIDAHREGAVVNYGDTIGVVNLAIEKSESAIIDERAIENMLVEIESDILGVREGFVTVADERNRVAGLGFRFSLGERAIEFVGPVVLSDDEAPVCEDGCVVCDGKGVVC